MSTETAEVGLRALVLADTGDLEGLKKLASSPEGKALNVNARIQSPPAAYNKGCVPLHYACRSGHTAVATYLVDELHADPQVMDNEGWNALFYAVYSGNTAVVELLKSRVDAPLWRQLLAQREFVHGWLPFDVAQHRQHRRIAALLGEPEAGVVGEPESGESARVEDLLRGLTRRRRVVVQPGTLVYLHRYELADSSQADKIDAFTNAAAADLDETAVFAPVKDTVTGAAVKLVLARKEPAPSTASMRTSAIGTHLFVTVQRLS